MPAVRSQIEAIRVGQNPFKERGAECRCLAGFASRRKGRVKLPVETFSSLAVTPQRSYYLAKGKPPRRPRQSGPGPYGVARTRRLAGRSSRPLRPNCEPRPLDQGLKKLPGKRFQIRVDSQSTRSTVRTLNSRGRPGDFK